MRVDYILSKGVGLFKEVMVYQKSEIRLLEKARQKRVTKEVSVTRETSLPKKFWQKRVTKEAPVTREIRLPEKARQKRVTEEAPVTRETNKKMV